MYCKNILCQYQTRYNISEYLLSASNIWYQQPTIQPRTIRWLFLLLLLLLYRALVVDAYLFCFLSKIHILKEVALGPLNTSADDSKEFTYDSPLVSDVKLKILNLLSSEMHIKLLQWKKRLDTPTFTCRATATSQMGFQWETDGLALESNQSCLGNEPFITVAKKKWVRHVHTTVSSKCWSKRPFFCKRAIKTHLWGYYPLIPEMSLTWAKGKMRRQERTFDRVRVPFCASTPVTIFRRRSCSPLSYWLFHQEKAQQQILRLYLWFTFCEQFPNNYEMGSRYLIHTDNQNTCGPNTTYMDK